MYFSLTFRKIFASGGVSFYILVFIAFRLWGLCVPRISSGGGLALFRVRRRSFRKFWTNFRKKWPKNAIKLNFATNFGCNLFEYPS